MGFLADFGIKTKSGLSPTVNVSETDTFNYLPDDLYSYFLIEKDSIKAESLNQDQSVISIERLPEPKPDQPQPILVSEPKSNSDGISFAPEHYMNSSLTPPVNYNTHSSVQLLNEFNIKNEVKYDPNKEEISYPATPMISIAEVEELQHKVNGSRPFKTPAEPRDNKIMQIDTTLHNKRQERLLRTIHKDIVRDRKNLTNTIRGDRQQIRNVFQDHKELQLAYQELQVLDIIEKIYQENFNKRKKLDILYYRKRTRTTKLVSSKLRVAVLEDRLRFEGPGTLPFEIHAKIVTAQVRDAILKQDAAIKVGDIYRHILNTMKWDAIYFDAVLNALKSDTRYQGRCMYNAIELGQLATEYLDDRKKEYKRLEAVVKVDLVHRVEDLQGLTCEVNEHNEKIKRYTRKDSDITLPAVNLNTNTDTQANVQFVCSMLDVLKNAFYIVDYHELYSWYINTKKSLKDEMQHQIDKANDNKHRKKRLCSLLVTIKSSLQHLQEYCKVMKGPHERRGSKQSEELGMKDIINIKSNGINARQDALTML
ncbi:coiled-coil domain-containing protein [Holotrichia oblita]|uniref:Coiled-coil domain-containing protein n=1 Tax=Holotrichia oblita TaxID=644536 RepID=A0ACB9TTP6_HOLOL|nr:coiled-coil domain-containing protein [Holotrichia oblita]